MERGVVQGPGAQEVGDLVLTFFNGQVQRGGAVLVLWVGGGWNEGGLVCLGGWVGACVAVYAHIHPSKYTYIPILRSVLASASSTDTYTHTYTHTCIHKYVYIHTLRSVLASASSTRYSTTDKLPRRAARCRGACPYPSGSSGCVGGRRFLWGGGKGVCVGGGGGGGG